MNMKKTGTAAALLLGAAVILWFLTRLLVPKYEGLVVEGNFTAEYYEDKTVHDVLILGNCEAYENISSVTLWQEYGITSYIRGNANQLISQSYYLLEDVLRYETPHAVLLSVSSMEEFEQENESYNRMTLDGMRWSPSKVKAIGASKLPEEHFIEYVFPILRFHSRFQELTADDFTYLLKRDPVAFSGYYLRADIRPAGDFPAARRRADYTFDRRCTEYLDKIRLLCEENGITLILFKAPALYPVWYDEWDSQISAYAETYGLTYLNGVADTELIGINYSHDTYDQGVHMNVYGAEKVAHYLGPVLAACDGVTDHRDEQELSAHWEAIAAAYEAEKGKQEQEFAKLGYVKQFYTGD